MNREAFYAALRRKSSDLFGTSMTQSQVEGCDAILDECIAQGATLNQAAYILATGYGETGNRMQPIRENMNYSLVRLRQVFSAKRLGPHPERLIGNPQAIANQVYNGMLGNRPGTDDGWVFRGGSIGQITGRDNYAEGAAKFGMSVEQFVAYTNTAKGAAAYLVRGMLGGWTTGRKLSEFVTGTKVDFVNARRTWNGTFEAAKYAAYAESFAAALREAGYSPSSTPEAWTPPKPAKPSVGDSVAAGGGIIGAGSAIGYAINPDDPVNILIGAAVAAALVLLIVLIKRKAKK